jgi:fatty-acyl-CoA synthase
MKESRAGVPMGGTGARQSWGQRTTIPSCWSAEFGPSTIPAVLSLAGRRFADEPWMAFKGEVQTFAHLTSNVATIAAGLEALGIAKGDRVGLFLGNTFEWLQIEYAVTALGAALVPLNTALRARELEHIVSTSEMNLLVWGGNVVGHDTLPLLQSLVPEAHDAPVGEWKSGKFPALRQVVGVGAGEWPEGVIPWAEIIASGRSAGPQNIPENNVTSDDVALIMFTSGTTGVPKGALITHGAIVDHLAHWVTHIGLGAGDRSILASPLFWTFGCTMNALVPLLAGSMIVLDDQFDPVRFLEHLVTFTCTHVQGVPTHYELALTHPNADGCDLSSVRVVQIGGSSGIDGLVQRIRERMPNADLVSSYGLTEAVIASTWTDLGDPLEDIISTVGHAAPDNDIELRDPATGHVVPTGAVGVLWVRGPNVTKGYLGNPEATKTSIIDGWLNTGDLASADARGYLSIMGRGVDAFKRGGANVYPAEIEVVLNERDDVAGAAVIGVPDPVQGEVGVAFVLRQPGTEPSEQDLLDYCRTQLASYKVPASIQFVDSLPLTPTGKIQKFVLREQWINANRQPEKTSD